MTPRATRISDEEWRKHREEITNLYRKNTLDRVIKLMNEKHNFQARYDCFSVNCSLQEYSYYAGSTSITECSKHGESGKMAQIAIGSLLTAGSGNESCKEKKANCFSMRSFIHLKESRRRSRDMSLSQAPTLDQTVSLYY